MNQTIPKISSNCGTGIYADIIADKDGVIPTSYNPYAEIEQLRSKVAELEEVVEKYGAITVRTLRQIIESTIKPSQPKEGEK